MNQKPLRTLLLWTLWAATSILAYVSMYNDTEVWDFVRNDPSRVTWLILALFLLGVAGSFVLAVLITLETFTAFHVEDEVKGQGLSGLGGKHFKRAVGRFFSALRATLDANGQINVEALLNTELAAYQRISHTVEVIGNLLITLGLIGTVAGLTLTLTGLTSSLDALGHDQELLLSGLRKAMAGMGTAFYTTLLGAVLGGVLLRVFSQITDHGVESLFDRLMRICLVYCSADLQPSLERDMRFLNAELEALGRRVKVLQVAFGESSKAMAEFRGEVSSLKEISRDENEELLNSIRYHKHYCEVLREELKHMRAINKPWWIRLRNALWSPKT
ncbi:MAG TPA: hypothetical protein ENK48_02795 [Gammaproteobacteria bacterium]|nr:hypothetical protein [Gammaproteobacteria bacterium]